MNKIFRIVFNASTGRYVVASEMAKGRTKASSRALAGLVLMGGTAAGMLSPAAFANGITVCSEDNTTYGMSGNGVGPYSMGCTTGSDVIYMGGAPSTAPHDAYADTTTTYISVNSASSTSSGWTGGTAAQSIKLHAPGSIVLDGVTDLANHKIIGLAGGSIADNSLEAVNGDQLFDSNRALAAAFGGGSTVDSNGFVTAPSYALTKANAIGGTSGAATDVGSAFVKVDGALGALDTRVTNNANSITTLQSTVNNMATSALVQQASAGAALTVGKNTDGASVDFTGTAGTRKLVGVSEGAVSATSKEAVNGSQLYATEQKVAANTSAIGALDTRVGTAETDIAGLKTRADATDAAVAKNTTDIAKNTTDIAKNTSDIAKNTTDIAKNTSDISALQTRADTTDAAVAANTSDISTLKDRADATDAAVAQNTADIAKNTGDISALDTRMGSAESSISNLDGRVTNVEGSVTNLTQQMNDGEVGLVKQDATSKVVTVAADKDGSEVNIAGSAGDRKLSGVAAGEISATSNQAVNGSQLNATNERVAANEGSIVNLDNRTTKNEGDIASLDSRTAKNEGDIASLDQRQGKTEGDVSELRQGVNGLDGRVSSVETNVASLNEKLQKTGTEVINQSRAYTDKRVEELHGEMDDRFNLQDERIDRMGAMGSAMSMMTASLGGLHTQNRAAVGTGFVNGQKALSVGYQRAISDRANVSLGGAFTSDDRSVGAAVGIGW
ncbi:ESPR-type extended signal peptide-containing protein [Lysobacter auxotrophicus]|uniref:Uncharacterized protein n=1 Tax=Lysobacter auxotrophicus TaxID=2992573 RepID=A0ABM8DFJ2_9GAMM|nr:ESPR-type extended signal peptide-containing protein [Lysobacter auxotrophicus]BDU17369.1 hypothetical protein LA521A_25700 [Lysobacter auxotrophicus]